MLTHRKKHEDSPAEHGREARGSRRQQPKVAVGDEKGGRFVPFSGALHGEPVRVHRIHGEKSEQNQGDLRGDEHILVDGFAMAAAHVIDRHHPASPLSFSFTLAAARGTCLGPSAPARPLPPAALAAAAGPGPGVWVVLGHFCALVDTVACRCTLHRDRRTHALSGRARHDDEALRILIRLIGRAGKCVSRET